MVACTYVVPSVRIVSRYRVDASLYATRQGCVTNRLQQLDRKGILASSGENGILMALGKESMRTIKLFTLGQRLQKCLIPRPRLILTRPKNRPNPFGHMKKHPTGQARKKRKPNIKKEVSESPAQASQS